MSESELPLLPENVASRKCPWCAETIRAEALKCRFCGSVLDRGRAWTLRGLTQPWVRPREGRMIAGVCAGLADQLGISVSLVRLVFVLGTIFSTGLFLLVYLAFWMAMSDERDGVAAARGDDLERDLYRDLR
jgi:phage shock protein PspC (stress-responsive transcriptional regulator)